VLNEIDLLPEEEVREETPGLRVSGPTLVSILVHTAFIIFLINAYHPIKSDDKAAPIARYVELIRQQPKEFTEAPGQKTDKARVDALWSDANRKASTPKPTGDQPTMKPGDGRSATFTPPSQQQVRSSQFADRSSEAATESREPRTANDLPADLTKPSQTSQANAAQINWHSVIKEVKVATLGGGQNLDLNNLGGAGGEKGFAEQGPLSFETQWYDWGAYAASMVAKIRTNWYENMPPLIRTGMKGVVTIRFTIQRDGRISDVEMLGSSSIPPYDFAAKHAIELSSPLNPLPKDFPNPSERVTCMFFYNSDPPAR